MNVFEHAQWIWSDNDDTVPNQHLCFRKKFSCQTARPTPQLHISADSDFVVYLNGVQVGAGQFSDWPEHKTYSTFNLEKHLRPGENTLAILAYYRGHGFATYAKGLPGLIAEIKNVLSSDTSWKCLPHPAFSSGMVPPTTVQMGFTTAFDARRDIDWASPCFDDSDWSQTKIQQYPAEYRTEIKPRPVPSLIRLPLAPATIAMQGVITRDSEKDSFAATVSADWLRSMSYHETFKEPKRINNRHPEICPPKPGAMQFNPIPKDSGNGYFVIADVRQETAGLLCLDITAPEGTVCDLAVGEHLDDGRVRAYLGGRNFADRYICKEGRNQFCFPFRRVAGRYVELHLTGMKTGEITLDYLGIMPTELAMPENVGFNCNDPLANRTHQIAARTLHLCMHEHYEDCPWREQALYAYDSRNQALYGYYLWGNYRFARTSLALLGDGIRPDGLLHLCAPCRMDLTIPIFGFVWVSELSEYLLHSGDLSLCTQYREQVAAMIAAVMPLYDDRTGLFRLHPEKHHWHFYEWTEGIDGCPFGSRIGVHSASNLYFYEMLGSYLEILRRTGQQDSTLEEIRNKLGKAIHSNFWNSEKQCYASILDNGKQQGFHEHIQALALYNKIVPEAQTDAVLNSLYRRELAPISFSAMSYLVRALMERGIKAREFVRELLTTSFAPIIMSGATSLWETALGSADFEDAGSLCHAWSSINVYYYHAFVLGIRPLEPGFAQFAIAPCHSGFYEASGTVATPNGNITVSWQRHHDGIDYHATGPDGLIPVLQPYQEFPLRQASYNGIQLLR